MAGDSGLGRPKGCKKLGSAREAGRNRQRVLVDLLGIAHLLGTDAHAGSVQSAPEYSMKNCEILTIFGATNSTFPNLRRNKFNSLIPAQVQQLFKIGLTRKRAPTQETVRENIRIKVEFSG
jgi:hypothetical protein